MRVLRLGTRGSKLALIQAEQVKEQLMSQGVSNEIEIVEIETKGDQLQNVSLPQLGGGGVFLHEIELALIEEEIDFAVHSLKDMPAKLPKTLSITAIPEIEDRRDVLLSRKHLTIDQLPRGAVIGTSSIRRAAQAKRMRGDIETKWIRGPIGSRIKQMEQGDFDAIILAASGLKRLGYDLSHITSYFSLNEMTPAPGQGALAIESRENDDELKAILNQINQPENERIIQAERRFLAHFDIGEAGPIGGYAKVVNQAVKFFGRIISFDGKKMIEHEVLHQDPTIAADKVAQHLINQGGLELVEQAKSK